MKRMGGKLSVRKALTWQAFTRIVIAGTAATAHRLEQ